MRLGGLQPNVNSSGIPRPYLPSYLPTYLLTSTATGDGRHDAAGAAPNPNPTPNPTPNPNPNQVMGGMMLLALHGPGGISLDQGAKKSI